MAKCTDNIYKRCLELNEQPIVGVYTINVEGLRIQNPYHSINSSSFDVVDALSPYDKHSIVSIPVERFCEVLPAGISEDGSEFRDRPEVWECFIAVEPKLRELVTWKEREEIDKLKSEITSFNSLSIWQRLKFLFKGEI